MEKEDQISTVGKLREFLTQFPDEASILTQVVGWDDPERLSWSMFLFAYDGNKDCFFRWDVSPLILSVQHPNMKTLPDRDRDPKDRELVRKIRELLEKT
jgi:hypothetical protein